MFKAIWNFLTGQTESVSVTQEPTAVRETPQTPEKKYTVHPGCSQAITNPASGVPFYDELMAFRSSNIELAMAASAKVGSWRMLIDMGSGHVVPAEYLEQIMKAMLSDSFAVKSMLYCLVQVNIMQNFPTVAAVKSL
jgi:hypothetical protein